MLKYEIDFLAVGEESKGGDAICFRVYDDQGGQFVGIIDGGTKASGQALVAHIRKYYGTETVHLVINTHPHADHTSGLTVVLEELEVQELMMHLPWEHSPDILHLFHDGRITDTSLADRIKKGLQQIHDLYELSLEKEIPVTEPFAGGYSPIFFLQFLGPTREYYQQLLPDFTGTPQAKATADTVVGFAQKAINWVTESWNEERLVDPVEGTNAENNSSVVTLLTLNGEGFLFTADAGVPALERVCDYCDQNGVRLRSFKLVQVPHHGSKRNVGPTILNRLVGEPRNDEEKTFTAMLSVPKKGEPKHPSRRVTNAFNRRGANVAQTCGQTVCHGEYAQRGWTPISVVPFYDESEADD